MGVLTSALSRPRSWKNEGPYESYALQVYEKYVATSPADTERFAETIRAYCTKWACQP